MSDRRTELLSLRRKVAELKRREERRRQSADGGLIDFVRYFWHILEPKTKFVEGWAFEAICEHLEAVTRGEIKRLLINVPPGFSKSLLVNVFWPAWEWGPRALPHLRWVAFSYASHLTLRDNEKFRNLIGCQEYQRLWGDRFKTTQTGVVKVANDKTGWKFASSVGGIGTGERGDRVLIDDPHNVSEGESDLIRTGTVRWFDESISNRVNDMMESVIVVIMQRVHDADVSGFILSNEPDYAHLMIPMEYDAGRRCQTAIGWEDPRTDDGELAWPERYPAESLARFKRNAFLWAGQYQQTPTPRGGGMFRDEWWSYYETKDGSVPPMDYIIASCDTAYTAKQENDYSACVVLGVWNDNGINKVMVLDAWQKRLILHGKSVDRLPNEKNMDYAKRAGPHWGLIEWIAHTCRRWGVDRLIVENRASGQSVAQEIRRQHSGEGWGVLLIDPKGDKEARAASVVGLWTDELVYVPVKVGGQNYAWVETLMYEMAAFPRGAHDDLVDAIVQGMRHLKATGRLVRHEERETELNERVQHAPQSGPIYDC